LKSLKHLSLQPNAEFAQRKFQMRLRFVLPQNRQGVTIAHFAGLSGLPQLQLPVSVLHFTTSFGSLAQSAQKAAAFSEHTCLEVNGSYGAGCH